MSKSATKKIPYFNNLMRILTSMLFFAVVVLSGITLLSAHADETNSPLNGRYQFHGVVTSGPDTGLSFEGKMALNTVQKGITGHVGNICALSIAPDYCTLLDGTTVNNVNITLTIHSIGQLPSMNATGAFYPGFGPRGGFKGTLSFRNGASLSSGFWNAPSITVPSASGIWTFSTKITQEPGVAPKILKGTLKLVQKGGLITGTYCTTMPSRLCIPVDGTNYWGYLFIYVGGPPEFVIKGTYTSSNQASGQLTMLNSKETGVWSINR